MKIKSSLITVSILLTAIFVFNSSNAQADVHVYDNNNQYLGILLGLGGEDVAVFIPSLGASWEADYDLGYIEACPGTAYFEFANCNGLPYENDPFPVVQDLSGSSLGKFYVVDFNSKNTFSPGSYIDRNCDCQPASGEPSVVHYQLTEVQMPFTTPIALPLRFEVRTRAVVIPLN